MKLSEKIFDMKPDDLSEEDMEILWLTLGRGAKTNLMR